MKMASNVKKSILHSCSYGPDFSIYSFNLASLTACLLLQHLATSIRFANFLLIYISFCQNTSSTPHNAFYPPSLSGMPRQTIISVEVKENIYSGVVKDSTLKKSWLCNKVFAFYWFGFLLQLTFAWKGLCFVDSYWSLVKMAWEKQLFRYNLLILHLVRVFFLYTPSSPFCYRLNYFTMGSILRWG